MYERRPGTISSFLSLQEQYAFIHQCIQWLVDGKDGEAGSVYERVSAFTTNRDSGVFVGKVIGKQQITGAV